MFDCLNCKNSENCPNKETDVKEMKKEFNEFRDKYKHFYGSAILRCDYFVKEKLDECDLPSCRG